MVGGYGTFLVFFAVAPTLTVNVRQRDNEIALLHRAGATPAQIKRMVVVESQVLTVTGVLFGTVAALAGAVPFGVVRVDAVLPGQGPGIWPAIVGIVAAATIFTSVGTAHQVLRTPAVEAMELAS